MRSHSPDCNLKLGGIVEKYCQPDSCDGSIKRTPESPPRSGPPISLWNLLTACTEFHPGAQKNGSNEDGTDPGPDSIEKARAESGSSGGLGSCTLMLASIAVRPLYRLGSRATLPTAFRGGATFGRVLNAGISAAIAEVR